MIRCYKGIRYKCFLSLYFVVLSVCAIHPYRIYQLYDNDMNIKDIIIAETVYSHYKTTVPGLQCLLNWTTDDSDCFSNIIAYSEQKPGVWGRWISLIHSILFEGLLALQLHTDSAKKKS